jgi:hypothetical protein
LRWFFIIGFFTSSWEDKFLEMFQLIKVCISFHSPYKNWETQAWGMYVNSIATLFWPSCLNPYFHTKSTFEKGDFAKFWISNQLGQWNLPHVLNCQRNNHVVGVPNLWKPMNTLTSLQIVIILINKAIKP